MKTVATKIPEVIIVEPSVYTDERGYIFESYNQAAFEKSININTNFVQDNHSGSGRGVLRGLHYQVGQAQGKLVRVISGEVFDVAVDIRRSSPTFGQWVGIYLSADNKRQMWIPKGFAHGFLVVSEFAELLYKTTDFYAPQHERCICWDDSDINIQWPMDFPPTLSNKDKYGLSLKLAEVFD